MRLSIGIIKGTGLVLQNPANSPVFQPLRAGHGDLHLYWQPVYQDVIRSVGPLAAFLPSATFEGSGEKVVFSHIEAGKDILSLTRPLSRSEGIPEDVLGRLDGAIKAFKAIAHRDGTSPDVRRFVDEFTLPSIKECPEAYRVFEPGLFTRRRYFILWGFEPIGLSEITRKDIARVQIELNKRSTSSQPVLGLLGRSLAIVSSIAVLCWLIAYLLLPRPLAKFEVLAEEKKMAIVHNQTELHKTVGVEFGETSYLWTFDDATPATSDLNNPEPTWHSPGPKKVTLKATQSSILWLSKSHTVESLVNVAPAPVMPPIAQDNHDELPKVLPRPADLPQEGENSTKYPTSDKVDGASGNMPKTTRTPNEKSPKNQGEDSSQDLAKNPDKGTSGQFGSGNGKIEPNDEGGAGIAPGQKPITAPPPLPKDNSGANDSRKRKAPEVIPISGGVNIIWFNSRADGVDGKRLRVSLDIEPPEGHKVERVSFDGKSLNYTGPFEQLVNIGPNSVEVELSDPTSGGQRRMLRSIIQFNRPFDVIDQPEIPPSRSPGGSREPSVSPKIDPLKVPELSPSESA